MARRTRKRKFDMRRDIENMRQSYLDKAYTETLRWMQCFAVAWDSTKNMELRRK